MKSSGTNGRSWAISRTGHPDGKRQLPWLGKARILSRMALIYALSTGIRRNDERILLIPLGLTF
jgi:hypothetical protein